MEGRISIAGVYSICCTSNGALYVGSSINLYGRLNRHLQALRNGDHQNKRMQGCWNKYGEASFKIEILTACHVDKLLEEEQNWIDKLEPCLNGKKIVAISPEDLSRFTRGTKRGPMSDEARRNMSLAKLGKPRKTPITEEAKMRMSEAAKRRGMNMSAESRRKAAESRRGKKRGPMSDETRAKMSESAKKRPMPFTAESRRKAAETKRSKTALRRLEKEAQLITPLAEPQS